MANAEELKREYFRKWRSENPEKVREYNKKWMSKHPEKKAEYNRRYWEKKALLANAENSNVTQSSDSQACTVQASEG